jgi:excisionase family DNA binding protein
MTTEVPRLLLRPTEAAQALGISRSKFYELLARREIRGIHIGTSLRVPIAELERYIAERLDREASTSNGGNQS